MRYLFVVSALLCAAFVSAAEPPPLRSVPPALKDCSCDVCECPKCDGLCTVPVLATVPYDPDHTCNRCGTFANVVERELPGGMHTHRCGNCGHEWAHADPGVKVPAIQYTVAPANPFAVGDCANGNCSRPVRTVASTVATSNVVRSVYGVERPRPVRRIFGLLFRPLRSVRGGGCCG